MKYLFEFITLHLALLSHRMRMVAHQSTGDSQFRTGLKAAEFVRTCNILVFDLREILRDLRSTAARRLHAQAPRVIRLAYASLTPSLRRSARKARSNGDRGRSVA